MSLRRSLCGVLLLGVLLPALPALAQAAGEVSLADAARQALTSNLDLLARRQQLAADRQEIGLARSPLLPQIKVGARGQVLDDDRSDSDRGNNKEESVLVAAGLSQVLYDEDKWASFDIQKHVYEGQTQELAAYELALVQQAANAFLELDRAQRVLDIQQRNREITRRNLQTSRARIAAGWSGEREVLRWEAELAGNDSEVRSAEVSVLQNRFELNRVRNRAPEAPATAAFASLSELGFAYARKSIVDAIASPEQDRRMRDFLVQRGLRSSPDLAALDASIAGAERQLTANRRAFWVPTLTFSAGVDHIATDTSGDDFNETEWGVRGELLFPVFQGGAKFAGLAQAREALASVRTTRNATARSLEQAIRATFAQASGAYDGVGFSERQAAAARKNFELVDASYVLGVASILDLLDAQAQQLDAEIALANAQIGFLESLVAAERTISFYAFLAPSGDVDNLLDELERDLARRP